MTFKKINIIILLSIITVSTGAYIVSAEENSTSSATSSIKARLEKPFEKGDLRNKAVELRQENKKERAGIKASTTEKIKELKEERKDIRASTTAMFKELKGERRIIAKNMQLKDYEIRKDALVKELNITLKNLDNIDSRINIRIASSTANGKDMTSAKSALVIAENKLATAKVAVNAFASFIYSTSTTSTTTTSVALDKPRKVGDEAIKAVKDARDAFKAVVVEVAHALGVNINATSTSSN